MHMLSHVLHSGDAQKAPLGLTRTTPKRAITMPGNVVTSSL